MSEPLPPSYVRLMRQNGQNADCAVATIAMLCGCNYEESLAACLMVNPEVLDRGMYWSEIRRAVDGLGCLVQLVRRAKYDIEEATGILNVKRKDEDHVVLLWAGRIVDGGTELWLDPDEYLKHYGYKAYSLLIRTE